VLLLLRLLEPARELLDDLGQARDLVGDFVDAVVLRPRAWLQLFPGTHPLLLHSIQLLLLPRALGVELFILPPVRFAPLRLLRLLRQERALLLRPRLPRLLVLLPLPRQLLAETRQRLAPALVLLLRHRAARLLRPHH